MKTILVTGGSGFIGHHFVEHILRNSDWNIVVLDKLSYAGDVTKLTDEVSFDPDRVRILWHDLRAPIMESLRERIGHVDYIVNFASESHVERSIQDPNPFVMNNVALALNMLDYAREVQPEKYIQISTDEVFGPAPEHYDFKEWDRHLPSNPYSASKSAQEMMLIAYWRTYGVRAAIANAMNVFGERQHPEKFIPLAMRRLMNEIPVPVHAELKHGAWQPGSRMWLHARNFSDAIFHILINVPFDMYPEAEKPTRFNVVGEVELTNLEVVLKVADILNVSPLYEYVDFHTQRPGHDRRYALDGTALRKTGWIPPFTFDESLERMVHWTLNQARV